MFKNNFTSCSPVINRLRIITYKKKNGPSMLQLLKPGKAFSELEKA